MDPVPLRSAGHLKVGSSVLRFLMANESKGKVSMKTILLALCASLIFSACGVGKKSSIEITYDGRQIPFETKSAWITAQNAIYGGNVQASDKNHALRWISLRNYDYEVTRALGANEGKLTAPEQVKLFLSIHDEAGTNEKTPIKPSNYSGANDGPMEFEFLNLTIFKDGKEESYQVSLGGQPNKGESFVKINSVSGDSVTGDLNVNVKAKDRVLTIKGPFTAKIFSK